MSNEAGQMSKNKKQQVLMPRLRFPEFRDAPAWSESALTGICDVNPAHDGLPESFYYIDLESVEAGTLRTRKRIERAKAPSRAQRYLRDGDIVYQTVRPYQRNNLLFDFGGDDDYVASTGYAQLRARESIGFLYQLIHTDSFVERVLAKCTGSNYPAIKSSDLESVSIYIPPNPAEQRKIADCLGSLDDLIAAEGRKLAALRDHKKGLMQQLFPREGETRPRLRFPEFQDAGEWMDAKLGELSEIVRGGSPRPIDDFLTRDPDGLNWLKIGDLETGAKYVTATEDRVTPDALSKTRVIEPGDLILSNSMSFGRPYLSRITTCIHDGWIAVRKISKRLGSEFLYYAIMAPGAQAFFEDWASGGGIRNLNIDIVKNLPMRFPSPIEQHRIADCLAALDDLIAAQAAKLDALRTHKRGLMQGLFPLPEDVGT